MLSDCTVWVPDIASAYQSRMKTADLSSPQEVAIFETAQRELRESGIAFENTYRCTVVSMSAPSEDDTMPDIERLTWAVQEELGMAIIMITHDLGIVADICDEVAVMYAGTIVEKGTLEDVFNHTKHPYTEGLFNSLPNIRNRTAKLQPIPGLMPDPTNLPEGCPFHPRCPYADEDCKKPQVVRNISDSHYVRCGAYDRPGFHIERKER